jgi:glycosyltransferase involved in cell wall biosynthesis
MNRFRAFGKFRQRLALVFDPVAVCESAECDVWLIPSVRLYYRLPFPSVLVIHDLVHVHYPDAVPAWDLEELEQLVPSRSTEATICACMSNFIREHDLVGTLRLDPNKVRMIQPAPPLDSPPTQPGFVVPPLSDGSSNRLKPGLPTGRPYLFYPAAFRSYKNHAVLIHALRLLRDKHQVHDLDLVFTGIHSVPQGLRRTIGECGLQDRVHVLGCVNRTELDLLYRNALATILPTLYEEICFPVYEALQRGCPVALSRIPALVEQYQAIHDVLLYFDPNDPEDVTRIILKIREEREQIRARQQAAAPLLWERTWQDAAGDWLKVLREAVERADKQSTPRAAA